MSMFQTEIGGTSSFLAFFFQQVGVCVFSVIWGAISAERLARLNGLGPGGSLVEAAINIASALGPAFLLGRLARSRLPHFAYSGRWVWLLPGTLLAAAALSSAFHSTLGRDLSDLLFPPSDGEALWAVVLFCYPTLGCIGYSLGVSFRSRRSAS